MTKVVHLMSTSFFSGAENVACQIINSFKNDIQYEMIYVSEIKEIQKDLENRNISYYKLEKFNYFNVKKAIDRIKPDIIHAHDIKASILAALFQDKAKIISHVHANHENMRKICLKTISYNFFTNNIDKIIWVSASALDNYRFKNRVINKSIVLYNAIDLNEIKEKIKLDKKEYPIYDLIYLGRLTYQKNPLRLIEIIAKLKEKKPDIKVAFVGNGDLEEQVKEAINEHKLNKNIKLYGFVSNPYKILNSSKIMIMTSRYEGTPMCALEAMSLGKPIISTPTDGLIDIIENGNNGYIIDNNIEFANTIFNLLTNERNLKIIQKNSLNKFKRISDITKYRNELEKIYSSVGRSNNVSRS